MAEQVLTEAVGGLVRSRAIEKSGYRKKPPAALADLTGDDFARCRRLLEVAEAVCRTDECAARLPETAARFAAGDTDVEHVAGLRIRGERVIAELAPPGPTSLDNLVLLCPGHHRLHHSAEWEMRIAADGLPEFVPPVFVDPERTPRRHVRLAAA